MVTISSFAPAPIKSVLLAHAENAAHLAATIRTSNLRTEPVSWFKTICERCDANLDGLRIAGRQAVDSLETALQDDAEFAAILAILLAERASEDAEAATKAVALLRNPSPDICEWAWWGLRLGPCSRLVPDLAKLVADSELRIVCAALDILAFHRLGPIELPLDLAQLDRQSLWFFLEAAGRSQVRLTLETLATFLTHPDQQVREASLRCAARRSLPGLVQFCRYAAARRTDSTASEAIAFLGVVGSDEDLPLLQSAASHPQTSRAALNAIGILGSPRALPFLLDALSNLDLSEPAATAIERITGQRVPRGMPVPMPEDLTDDELDVWETIPPIDVTAARRCWSLRSKGLSADKSWQVGICVSDQPLADGIFDRLPLRIRYDLYLRQRALAADTPDWELDTWFHLQKNPTSESVLRGGLSWP